MLNAQYYAMLYYLINKFIYLNNNIFARTILVTLRKAYDQHVPPPSHVCTTKINTINIINEYIENDNLHTITLYFN